MKLCFILNPRSGHNARRPWLANHIREFIASRSLDATLVTTTGPQHATALASDAIAAGCTRVVAVGGDGTMNEIAQALLNSPAALSLVPCGSGNGLALHLGIPTRLNEALALAADPAARVAAIDTGSANGRPFFNAMGCGFDAEISRRFNRLTRRGLAAYARIGLSAFRSRRSEWVVIHGAGQTKALLTLRVDDGQLDLVAVRPVGFASAVPLIARLFVGKFSTSPGVFRLRSARFLIERSGPGLLHTDGETHETGALVEIKVHPRSLRLVVPVHSRVSGESTPPVPAGTTGFLP